MGQSPKSPEAHSTALAPTTSYPIDPRMIDYSPLTPTFFSSATHKFIDELQALQCEIPTHPLQKYLINGIIKLFSLLTRVVESSSGVLLEEEGSVDEWSGLSSEEEFLKTLTGLKRQYEMELSLMQLYKKYLGEMERGVSPSRDGETQRLKTKYSGTVPGGAELDENLILRLFFHFYLCMMRINANQSHSLLHFHIQTGRQLCLLIYYNQLSVSQLFSLLYYLVHIDRHGLERSGKLPLINQKYHSMCLQKRYTTNIARPKCQMLQMATRLYLDELYLRSIRQAEDPEVKNEDDALLPTKMFPIYRVKSKVKN